MELFSLKNKVVIVTGACGLLGRQHVEAICIAGGTPILLDIEEDKLKNYIVEIKNKYNLDIKDI